MRISKHGYEYNQFAKFYSCNFYQTGTVTNIHINFKAQLDLGFFKNWTKLRMPWKARTVYCEVLAIFLVCIWIINSSKLLQICHAPCFIKYKWIVELLSWILCLFIFSQIVTLTDSRKWLTECKILCQRLKNAHWRCHVCHLIE